MGSDNVEEEGTCPSLIFCFLFIFWFIINLVVCTFDYRRKGPSIISLSPLSLATDVTDLKLRTSGHWLGTRTEAGGTAILA